MNPIIFILWCLASGALYRLGGCALNLPLKTKWRDWGCGLCGVMVLGAMMAKGSVWGYWCALASLFLLSWPALASYNDRWGTDGVDWYEWVLNGFCIGVAAVGIAWYTGSWLGLGIRTVVLMAFMPYSNKLQLKIFSDPTDGVEGSRGIVIIATLPLLVI